MSGSWTSTKYSLMRGSRCTSWASAALRTTCLWTWLLLGTSITKSPSTCAEHDKRRPGCIGWVLQYSCSTADTGERLSLLETTPCLENSPSDTKTWQRPQIPRPPHTESMSTPKERAACSKDEPTGKRPRRPEGVKTTNASLPLTNTLPKIEQCLACAATGSGFAATSAHFTISTHGRRLSESANPAHAIWIMPHHHVGCHTGLNNLSMQRICNRRGHT